MKTRAGFVSNSSSSSFVVRRFDDMFSSNKKSCLTKEQEKLLKENRFVLQICYYPHQVDMVNRATTKKDLQIADWVKSVSCNQDYEIEFLLQHRISFMADVHYEHYTMIYDGKSDVLLIAQNYGKQAQMNGNDKVNFNPWCKTGVKRTTGKTYLKTHKL